MRINVAQLHADENVYVGIDLHRNRWHISIRTNDTELFSAGIPATLEALERALEPYGGHCLETVYEAGYFGRYCFNLIFLTLTCGGLMLQPPSTSSTRKKCSQPDQEFYLQRLKIICDSTGDPGQNAGNFLQYEDELEELHNPRELPGEVETDS
jgi:hypothetical protein